MELICRKSSTKLFIIGKMMNTNKVTRITAEKLDELEECSISMAETDPGDKGVDVGGTAERSLRFCF